MTNSDPGIARLTSAQKEALSVLVTAGGRVAAGKRRSTHEPRPYVNERAANSLVRLGLARCIDPDLERGYAVDSGVPRGMVCTYKYEATAEGRKVVEKDPGDLGGRSDSSATRVELLEGALSQVRATVDKLLGLDEIDEVDDSIFDELTTLRAYLNQRALRGNDDDA